MAGLSNAGPGRPGSHAPRLVVPRLALFRTFSRDTPAGDAVRGSARLGAVLSMARRKPVSEDAQRKYEADVALAQRFDDLLLRAEDSEHALRHAQAARAPLADLHRLGMDLERALTDVMRAAFAAERAEIGPRGYDDRIYRRKAKATPAVRVWTAEAERLLTLRESHQLTGIVRLPPTPAARPA